MDNPSANIDVKYFTPSADLRCFIRCYWMVHVKDAGKFDRCSQISPSGYPELIFHFGGTIAISTSGGRSAKVSEDTLVAGQITQPVHLHSDLYINCLCVKLQPCALRALFNIDCSEFTDRATSLEDIIPGMQKTIYNQLSEATSDEKRIGIIEYHLRILLKKNHMGIDPVLCAAIKYLKANHNDVGGLEQIVGSSNRSLQRRLKENVGLSPKTLERIFRFNKAYHLVKYNKDLDLQDISFHLGYYDLSHLINEFKEFTGRSPVQYFKKEDVLNSLFAGLR